VSGSLDLRPSASESDLGVNHQTLIPSRFLFSKTKILFNYKGYGRMNHLLIYVMFSRKLEGIVATFRQISVNYMDNDG
jgi:hypothetical protein